MTRWSRAWRTMGGRLGRGLWVAAGLVWLAATTAGLASLMRYDNRAGTPARAPDTWPLASRLARDRAGQTLVVLAHPQCDCTRASLGELAELLARATRPPRAYVVFIKPGGVPGGWERTSLWRQASLIPGVTLVRDDDGREARQFGVETSGQMLLYGAGGELLFAGGATGARGKPGNNAGRATLLAWIDGSHPVRAASAVFGCELFSPVERPLTERSSPNVVLN